MSRSADEQDWSEKTVFSTGEAAQICNVSQQTIIRCFDSGRLQGFRVPGSKFRRIPREELVRFMQRNNIPLGVIEGASRRVLCILEEPNPVEAAVLALSDHGRMEVRLATDAYDAGIQTIEFRPHVILLDERVEGVSLAGLCERMGRLSPPDRPRVVSVGHVSGRAEHDAKLRAGADGVIGLPLSEQELGKALAGWIRPAGGDHDGA
ncbi:MAG: helix-turn-helix domain-containing protein [Phycisphaeraceae bacterium]|nr:MAG: helix-turn-helix domain-containing protein [Phycisphaeraceae bacterium]